MRSADDARESERFASEPTGSAVFVGCKPSP
jgi:hypothetical protein